MAFDQFDSSAPRPRKGTVWFDIKWVQRTTSAVQAGDGRHQGRRTEDKGQYICVEVNEIILLRCQRNYGDTVSIDHA